MRSEKAWLLSSSSWFITFLFLTAIHSLYHCRLQHFPGVTPGTQVFAQPTTSKHVPSPIFFFLCFVFSLSFNQYISISFLVTATLFFCHYLSHDASFFPAPSLPFLSLYISLGVNPAGPKTSKACFLSYCSSNLHKQAPCQGQVPSGEDPEQRGYTLCLILCSYCGKSKGPCKESCHNWRNL